MSDDVPVNEITELDVYQTEAFKTAVFPPEIGPLYCAMGVLGEAGELGSVLLDVMDRMVEADNSNTNNEFHMVRTHLRAAVNACATIELLKKQLRKGEIKLPQLAVLTPDEVSRLRSEQGDNLWYQAGTAEVNGYKLSDAARDNIHKLRERREAGVIVSAGETIEERQANQRGS